MVTVVSEETEEPVAGAVVKVLNRSKTKVLTQTTTDAQGRARLNGLAIGDVFVEVVKEGEGLDRSLITIKSGTWVATRAFVGPGVTVHENVVVGAGAVVVRDVEPGVVVAGNPATVVRQRTIDRP